jgi:hypothetical protein
MLMGRKRINQSVEYYVTGIGYCVGGQIDAARIQAHKAGQLRSDIWNEFGSLKAWGMKADALYKAFQVSHPPSDYGIDFKQWQQTFNRVIDDIHACQDAAKSWVIRKIYSSFSQDGFRDELVKSLNTKEWMDYPLLHRWMRDAYRRGHTKVNHQICVGTGNGAKVSRVSRNGTLLGFRNGDSFFTFDGVVLQADCNAARNIEARFDDPEMTCYMKHSDVRRVLIHRTASFLAAMGLTLLQAVSLNWLDAKHLQGKKARIGTGKSRSQGA